MKYGTNYKHTKIKREPMWSIKDIAEYAKVDKSTVYRWFSADNFEPCESTLKGMQGSVIKNSASLYSRKRVLAYLAARKNKGESQCN